MIPFPKDSPIHVDTALSEVASFGTEVTGWANDARLTLPVATVFNELASFRWREQGSFADGGLRACGVLLEGPVQGSERVGYHVRGMCVTDQSGLVMYPCLFEYLSTDTASGSPLEMPAPQGTFMLPTTAGSEMGVASIDCTFFLDPSKLNNEDALVGVGVVAMNPTGGALTGVRVGAYASVRRFTTRLGLYDPHMM